MKKLKIKSEAFFKNYCASIGVKVFYNGGRMKTVDTDGVKPSVVDSMVQFMGGTYTVYNKNTISYHCTGWNWPKWMCEEIDDES